MSSSPVDNARIQMNPSGKILEDANSGHVVSERPICQRLFALLLDESKELHEHLGHKVYSRYDRGMQNKETRHKALIVSKIYGNLEKQGCLKLLKK